MRPEIIEGLIDENIKSFLDKTAFQKELAIEEAQKRELFKIAGNYTEALTGASVAG